MKWRTCWCTKAILGELNSFPMWTLSLGLCYIFWAQKSSPAKCNYTFSPLIYSAESSVGFGRREEGTQHAAKVQLSVRTKSCTFCEDMFATFLNAINTDFELLINNLSATVHNNLPRHSKARYIAQQSEGSTWTNMETTSFIPENFFFGGGGGQDTCTKTQIFLHCLIRTASNALS